jgi:glycosyltransferase involved in cell wall biosynthesis
MPLTVLSVGYPLAQISARTPGGAEQVLSTLDKRLVESGHKSLVLAPARSRCRGLLIPAQVPTGVLDQDAKLDARREFKKLLDRTLSEFRVDIVHMHGLDFHEYLPDWDGPVVVTLHLPLSWYAPDALRCIHRSVTLVCVSKSQAGSAPIGMPTPRVICNGIEISQFRSTKGKSNYAVVLSRICPEKGIHLAIEAAERASVDLMIAGSVFEYSEHRQYFETMIRPRLTDRVHFIGPVGGDRKAALLSGASCLLIPSLAPETSSLVAMEAMSAGIPVVAFPTGALPEIIDDGRTGFLVNSIEEMAEALGSLGSISAAICRREAENRFSATGMVRDYFELYVSVVESGSVAELQAA